MSIHQWAYGMVAFCTKIVLRVLQLLPQLLVELPSISPQTRSNIPYGSATLLCHGSRLAPWLLLNDLFRHDLMVGSYPSDDTSHCAGANVQSVC